MNNSIRLPNVEEVSKAVHKDWMDNKLKAGITSRIFDQTGEELMVDYELLSEAAKELDRSTVVTVYKAIIEAHEDAIHSETHWNHWSNSV